MRGRRRGARRVAGRVMLMGLCASVTRCLSAPTETMEPPDPAWGKLSFLSPAPERAIAGERAFVWVVQDGTVAAPQVILEGASDGKTFAAIATRPGPDRGVTSHTFLFDATALPRGPLTLRARYPQAADGPGLPVTVAPEPRLDCTASRADQGPGAAAARLECTAPEPGAGEVVELAVDFGDGKSERLRDTLAATHTYERPGKYSVAVDATTAIGLHATFWALLEVDLRMVAMAPVVGCGCDRMTLATRGTSQLSGVASPGVVGPVQLGPSPSFATFNFEIHAKLVPGSNPDLCDEGQLLRRTTTGIGGVTHKGVCTTGLVGRECGRDADCHDRTCRGGTEDGKPANDRESFDRCVRGGGRVRVAVRGACRTFPFAGSERADDNYTTAAEDPPKIHTADEIVWLDGPGEYNSVGARMYSSDMDFFAFVNGRGGPSCSCHFQIHVEGDPATGAANAANTRLTIVNDAETRNCVEVGRF